MPVRILLVAWLCTFPFAVHAQQEPHVQYLRAEVQEITTSADETMSVFLQLENGKQVALPYSPQSTQEPLLTEGEGVVLQALHRADGSTEYILLERYRLPWLAALSALFVLFAVGIGGKTGARSVAGLALSIAILGVIVVPAILAGYSPLAVSLAGAFLIASTSIYLSHGIRRRTTLALISILVTLAAATGLAVLSVLWTKLFGIGSEEAMFLQSGPLDTVQLRGLLLGGIIIGTLGVLDDIATAQTAAVEELARANSRMGFRGLFRAGFSVGKEHIASLMNTLALAYVGTSLPLLLLFTVDTDTPLWVILNSQFLAEEIVRTLIGSTALVLAVPVSTYLAAQAFSKAPPDPHGTTHTCLSHALPQACDQ